ncbi:MAG: hypothetical protein LUD77_12085 [Clostridiales bacterium]|nr:hypothetical protein [Clostridiales bacterium]
MKTLSNRMYNLPIKTYYNPQAVIEVLAIDFYDFAVFRLEFLEGLISDFQADLAETEDAYMACSSIALKKETDELKKLILAARKEQAEIKAYLESRKIN